MIFTPWNRLARVAGSCAIGLAVAGSALAQTIERMKLTDGELSCTQLYAEVQQMDTAIQLSAPPAGAVAMPAPAVTAPAAPAADSGGLAALLGGMMAPGGAAAGLAPGASGVPVGALADPSVQRAVARARAAGYSDAQINTYLQLGAARAGYPVGAAALVGGQVAAAPAPVAAAPASAFGGLFGALAGRGAQVGGAGSVAAAGGLFGTLTQAAPAPVAAPAPQAMPVVQPAPGGGLAAQAQARKEHLTGLFLNKGCKLADVRK
ncbi:MAG: hypothetical protein RLZZ126_1381 [Pseudomonadota bacterium]|jgi:hypothetical protein